MIENLGEITGLEQEQAVADVRAAYNSLTEEQEKVTNLAVLEAAEQKIQALKEEQNSAETDTGLMSEPETEQATANVNSPIYRRSEK